MWPIYLSIGLLAGFGLSSVWYGLRYRLLLREASRLQTNTHVFMMELAEVALNKPDANCRQEVLDLCEKFLGGK